MLRLSLNRLATTSEITVALRHMGLSYEDSDDSAVLKARYKELVRRHHPDAGGDERTMRDIITSFRVLTEAAEERLQRREEEINQRGESVSEVPPKEVVWRDWQERIVRQEEEWGTEPRERRRPKMCGKPMQIPSLDPAAQRAVRRASSFRRKILVMIAVCGLFPALGRMVVLPKVEEDWKL